MYEELDNKIVQAIKEGNKKFSHIHMCADFGVHFREIDRRLQAIRKRGVITYSRATGWTLAETNK